MVVEAGGREGNQTHDLLALRQKCWLAHTQVFISSVRRSKIFRCVSIVEVK